MQVSGHWGEKKNSIGVIPESNFTGWWIFLNHAFTASKNHADWHKLSSFKKKIRKTKLIDMGHMQHYSKQCSSSFPALWLCLSPVLGLHYSLSGRLHRDSGGGGLAHWLCHLFFFSNHQPLLSNCTNHQEGWDRDADIWPDFAQIYDR